ncbi:MAG: hypothetical protein ACP5JG_11760 [Anaerolineae bacterium]
MSIHIVDEKLVQRIERIARLERREEVDVIARALELYEQKTESVGGRDFLLAIASLGSSEDGDISERDEEILSKEVDPLRGWDFTDSS